MKPAKRILASILACMLVFSMTVSAWAEAEYSAPVLEEAEAPALEAAEEMVYEVPVPAVAGDAALMEAPAEALVEDTAPAAYVPEEYVYVPEEEQVQVPVGEAVPSMEMPVEAPVEEAAPMMGAAAASGDAESAQSMYVWERTDFTGGLVRTVKGAPVYDTQALKNQTGTVAGGCVVLAFERVNAGTVMDALQVAFAVDGQVFNGWTKAENLEILSTNEAQAVTNGTAWQGWILPAVSYTPAAAPAQEQEQAPEAEQKAPEQAWDGFYHEPDPVPVVEETEAEQAEEQIEAEESLDMGEIMISIGLSDTGVDVTYVSFTQQGEDLYRVRPQVSGGSGSYVFNYWILDGFDNIVASKEGTTDTQWDVTLEQDGCYKARVFATDWSTSDSMDSDYRNCVSHSSDPMITVFHLPDSRRAGQEIEMQVRTANIDENCRYALFMYDGSGNLVGYQDSNRYFAGYDAYLSVQLPFTTNVYLIRLAIVVDDETTIYADSPWFYVEEENLLIEDYRLYKRSEYPMVGEEMEVEPVLAGGKGAYALNYWIFNQYGQIVESKTNTYDKYYEFSLNTEGVYLLRIYVTDFVTDTYIDTPWFYVRPDTPYTLTDGAELTLAGMCNVSYTAQEAGVYRINTSGSSTNRKRANGDEISSSTFVMGAGETITFQTYLSYTDDPEYVKNTYTVSMQKNSVYKTLALNEQFSRSNPGETYYVAFTAPKDGVYGIFANEGISSIYSPRQTFTNQVGDKITLLRAGETIAIRLSFTITNLMFYEEGTGEMFVSLMNSNEYNSTVATGITIPAAGAYRFIESPSGNTLTDISVYQMDPDEDGSHYATTRNSLYQLKAGPVIVSEYLYASESTSFTVEKVEKTKLAASFESSSGNYLLRDGEASIYNSVRITSGGEEGYYISFFLYDASGNLVDSVENTTRSSNSFTVKAAGTYSIYAYVTDGTDVITLYRRATVVTPIPMGLGTVDGFSNRLYNSDQTYYAFTAPADGSYYFYVTGQIEGDCYTYGGSYKDNEYYYSVDGSTAQRIDMEAGKTAYVQCYVRGLGSYTLHADTVLPANLSSIDVEEEYKIVRRAGGKATVKVSTDNAIAFNYYLYDENGNIVASKEGTTDLTWDITWPAGGSYVVKVFATDFATSSQQFSRWFNVADNISLAYGQTFAALRPTLITFTPQVNARYSFYTSYPNGDSGDDTCAYLYDKDFNELQYNDDGGEGLNCRIDFVAYAGETYYLYLRHLNESNYTFYAYATMGSTAEESTGIISDFFTEGLPVKGYTMSGVFFGRENKVYYTNFYLYDQNYTELAKAENLTTDEDGYISWDFTVPYGGNLILRVIASDGVNSEYRDRRFTTADSAVVLQKNVVGYTAAYPAMFAYQADKSGQLVISSESSYDCSYYIVGTDGVERHTYYGMPVTLYADKGEWVFIEVHDTNRQDGYTAVKIGDGLIINYMEAGMDDSVVAGMVDRFYAEIGGGNGSYTCNWYIYDAASNLVAYDITTGSNARYWYTSLYTPGNYNLILSVTDGISTATDSISFTVNSMASIGLEGLDWSTGPAVRPLYFTAPATGMYYLYKYGDLSDGSVRVEVRNARNGNYIRNISSYENNNAPLGSILLTEGQSVLINVAWRNSSATHAFKISRTPFQ